MPRKKFLRNMLLIVLLVAGFGVRLLYPGYRRMRVFNRKLELLGEDIKVLEEKIEEKNRKCREQIEAFLNPDSFEREKEKRKLGWMEEGEVAYKFIFKEEQKDDPQSEEPAPYGH